MPLYVLDLLCKGTITKSISYMRVLRSPTCVLIMDNVFVCTLTDCCNFRFCNLAKISSKLVVRFRSKLLTGYNSCAILIRIC